MVKAVSTEIPGEELEEEAVQSKTIKELLKLEDFDDLPEISPAVLERADLSLPETYLIESMAEELVAHLMAYHSSKVGVRTARAQGDHSKAEQLGKQMGYSRLAAALIQDEHKGVKGIADQISAYRAQTVKDQRSKRMDAKK
ncbi:MAG: hypothetical protein V3U60_06940 [Gammaproteobacteria bacterium]